MIQNFTLKFGPVPGQPGEPIRATPVTVFVGPNNSGKSKVLQELFAYCRNGHLDANDVILSEVTHIGVDRATAELLANQIQRVASAGESVPAGHIIVASRYGRQSVPYDQLLRVAQDPSANPGAFCGWILRHLTLMLDGQSRIGLTNQQPAGDMQQSPDTSFQVLFRDDAKRAAVRRMVYDAIGRYLVIDPSQLGVLRLRLSDVAPESPMQERGIHAEAVSFHAAAQLIDTASDGVKAFAGIVTEILAGDPSVIFVDEPEAFLHPALAAKLGQEVAKAAVATDKRVLVSTHSPQFVMGCIQSGAPVNIIRLTFRGGVPTSRILPSEEILELMRHPLLRSTGLLSGLFYEFVVVTESDADRAFYQEVNERLLQFSPDRGIPNCLFINAQNKQTVHTLLRPLRKLGIPAAAIVDVDVWKEGGIVWTNLMNGASVPDVSQPALSILRQSVKRAMDATGRDMKREGGIQVLAAAQMQGAVDLLAQLERYGIFVVPGGELESWLKHLGATGHGPMWLINMFEALGEDPADPRYVLPANDDVWSFMTKVRQWLFDPDRKGIPS